MSDVPFVDDCLSHIVSYVQKHTKHLAAPTIGIVCGSGLGGLTKHVKDQFVIHYHDIPSFPVSTVVGHAGELVFGTLGGKQVVCMRGRHHLYEGWAPGESVIGVKTMIALGVKLLIVTNAAGGVNSEFLVGDVMVMEDHINIPGMAGNHPLSGANDPRFGTRFPPMSYAYTKKLRDQLRATAAEMKFSPNLREGTYVALSGPSYETPHEIEFLRIVGGDCVGMSTAAEVTIAAHAGVEVLGLSMITNACVGVGSNAPAANHEEVIDTINMIGAHIEQLVQNFVAQADTSEIGDTKAYEHFEGVRNSCAMVICKLKKAVVPVVKLGALVGAAFFGYKQWHKSQDKK